MKEKKQITVKMINRNQMLFQKDPIIKKIQDMPKSSLQDMFKIVYLTASGPEKRRIKGILTPSKSTKWIIYCKKCKEFHYEKTRKAHRAILV